MYLGCATANSAHERAPRMVRKPARIHTSKTEPQDPRLENQWKMKRVLGL